MLHLFVFLTFKSNDLGDRVHNGSFRGDLLPGDSVSCKQIYDGNLLSATYILTYGDEFVRFKGARTELDIVSGDGEGWVCELYVCVCVYD